MNPEHPFFENMNQLIELLKKMIKDVQPGAGPSGMNLKSNASAPNVNFYFVNFLGLPEDWMEMEDVAEYENWQDRETEHKTRMNPSDLEFFKRNGIIF